MTECANVRFFVNPANPGQFFAACGLLEIADRLWGGAEGAFESGEFRISPTTRELAPLPNIVEAIAGGRISLLNPERAGSDDESDAAWPLLLTVGDTMPLRLDWWRDKRSGGKALKVWAGTMHAGRIATALLAALRSPAFHDDNALNVAMVVQDPDDVRKKKEPFYFDARRGGHTTARDVGFSPDAVGTTTVAYPVVELLCLIGLQRCRPRQARGPRARHSRLFEYFTWSTALPPAVVNAAVQGLLACERRSGYRFESRFRTDQRKHKAFAPAILIEGAENE
jgi:CRISPR-associated protein Csb3